MRAGDDAVSAVDENNNNCQDIIEDIAKQLIVAHHIFINRAGFRSPFDSPRYEGLQYFLVVIRDKNNSLLSGKNGVTNDEITSIKTLNMAISRQVNPINNATPVHEYCHFLQNSMTYFKNAWYSEGIARWAEDAVAVKGPIAKTRAQLEELLNDETQLNNLSYNAAEALWIPLANLCIGSRATLFADDPVLSLTYSNGEPVMKDFIFSGALTMALVLRELEKLDDVSFAENAYNSWSEARQNDIRNTSYIAQGVKNILPLLCCGQ